MEKTSRSEHMQWCKDRALKYLPGDTSSALASITCDLSTHDGTQGSVSLCALGFAHIDNPEEMRRFILGFN